jgi:hypothetical protein
MNNIKTNILEKVNYQTITWFTSLTVAALVVPHYIHNQLITGPIVNAILFLACMTLGAGNAIMIGLLPSVVALISGLLPLPLAPMIPFIMISNAIMIITFSYLNKINYWVGILGATLFKYAFLFLTSTIVVNLITNKTVAAKAASTMMAYPQIITAIAGGVIAFGVMKALKKNQDE